jgi:hypothetical protein
MEEGGDRLDVVRPQLVDQAAVQSSPLGFTDPLSPCGRMRAQLRLKR